MAAQLYGSPTRSGRRRDQRKTVTTSASGHEQRRDDGGREQGAGRDRRDRCVDHRRDAGRHDRADQRRARAQADGELGRVALLPHVADLDRADAGRIGQRRAAHPREAEADRDVHVGEAGAQRAEQEEGGVVQAVGDLRSGRHDPDHDEQRDGEQRPAVDALHHQAHAEVQGVVLDQQVDQRRARGWRTPSGREEGTGRGSR